VEGVRNRISAKVIIVDEADRILLMAHRDPSDGLEVWFAPGGGAEPGESLEEAARRELAEEVSELPDLELFGPVWTRHHLYTWDGRTTDLNEWFFVGRLSDSGMVTEVREGTGGEHVVRWKWWSVAELERFDVIVAPRRLPELLPPLLRGEWPSSPIDAGV